VNVYIAGPGSVIFCWCLEDQRLLSQVVAGGLHLAALSVESLKWAAENTPNLALVPWANVGMRA
jgi:hypothetical protein